jgi:hypothetical protein
MKYTLNSQDYNDIFKNAQEQFDLEMIKRDSLIEDMSKKLMIINHTNEFINNKLNQINASSYRENKLKIFDKNISGVYNQYGYMIHPKFKSEPIDIFNLKLVDGGSMFKKTLECKLNGEVNEEYLEILKSEKTIDKKIVFERFDTPEVTITYRIKQDNNVSLGTMRFNVIEIDPYISGAYSIKEIKIYTLDTNTSLIKSDPDKVITDINNIAKTRIILDKKMKFCEVSFTFSIEEFASDIGTDKVYPFGLKHIHFYEANFLEDSCAIMPIYSNDYFEYIYNDITVYTAKGIQSDKTTEDYNIEFYTDFENNTLTGRIYASSEAQAYRIIKNTKVIYAKIPLILENKLTKEKEYLDLLGILFNYTTEEPIIF